MLKGIIFDLDGTLVDSLSVTFDAFNHGITHMGGRSHSPQEIMQYFGPGEDQIFAKIVGAEKAAAAYEACRKYLDSRLSDVPLHAGVGELLEKIKSADIPIAIVTGRSWDTTEMILKHHRLMDRFVTVIANDHVGSPKPSPEGLHLALSRMRLEPAQTFYVGDSAVDMLASRSAGARGIAALWDLLAKRDLLAPYSPHHWADHPLDILEFWKSLS